MLVKDKMEKYEITVLAIEFMGLANVSSDRSHLMRGTIFLVEPIAAFRDAIAYGHVRQAFLLLRHVVCAEEEIGRLARVLAVCLVRAVTAILLAVAFVLEQNAHLVQAGELVGCALVSAAPFVLVGRVSGAAVIVRVAFPRLGDAPASHAASKLIGAAR